MRKEEIPQDGEYDYICLPDEAFRPWQIMISPNRTVRGFGDHDTEGGAQNADESCGK